MTILRPTTKERMDDRDVHWQERQGPPVFWMPWDGNRIRIYPYLEGLNVTVGYIESPAAMDAEGGPYEPDPRFPADKAQYLPWAAAAHLLTLDGPSKNLERANVLFEEFQVLVTGGIRVRSKDVPAGR